ncbi:hypothetical protein [Thermococcus sibiricus]|uniref:Uncharacterized protein n=1 Tax=Thermococcus sibiricus TaxID=172049 RepID=A0A117L239_9EURY|nr:hypothetical protein [Thermococcus sibiricus]KUK18248.1 MAG: Uncharacterized protein XD54_0496 [Thermococcus sibiricus]MBC7108968.1 hypothetical protein [Methanomassiliicoccales archaeon]
MRRFLTIFILLLFVQNALALSVELGIDEVLVIDNTTVTFDVAKNNPGLIFLILESENESVLKALHFGESVSLGLVNYTVGSLDVESLTLKLHILGNYSRIEVLKRKDIEIALLEAFDKYLKVKIRNTGYYEINDTLLISSQGIVIREEELHLRPGEEVIIKIMPPYTQLTFTLEEAKISKSIVISSLEGLVTIDRIWRDDKLHVVLKNHGDAVNATVKLLFSGMTIDKKEVIIGTKEQKEIIFEKGVTQGTIVVDYGIITQESFYFEAPVISIVKTIKEGEKLQIWLRNEGDQKFEGKATVYQNGVIVSEPYYLDVSIPPGGEVLVEFTVPEDAQILTIGLTSQSYSATFPVSIKTELEAKAVNSYAKAILGGTTSYAIVILGNGKVEFGVEGLPESIKAYFYYGDAQVGELDVVQNAQVALVLKIPNLPQGFVLNKPIDFNVTVNEIKIPVKLEVTGMGILPVYGDNWLAKVNYTSEYHHLGLPYRFAGNEITPPFVFEPWDGEKIAITYGRYIRQGKDVRIHLLDSSGKIVQSSTQERGRSDFLIFNLSEFMLMIEGENYFDGALLVADYLREPKNISFELKKREFGEGLRTFIINATSLRGQRLQFSLTSNKDVELRAYYFTLNNEKENFDPLSTNFRGVFKDKRKSINGEIGIRSYEDFVVITLIGEGNVTLEFKTTRGGPEVSELATREVYLLILGLIVLLVLVIYLEKKMG